MGDVQPAFAEVSALLTNDSPSKPAMSQLLRYVSRQWLQKSSIGPARLSVRDNPSRTNNALESFHSVLGRRVKVAHPNLFTFLAHLQRTTTDNETEIQRLDCGLRIRRAKKRSNLVNDARIKVCINR